MEQDLSGTIGRTGSGGQATEQAKQQGQRLTRQARRRADELANRGGEQVKSQLETQKHQAAQRMTPVQTALRETAQQLRRQSQDSMAQYADDASDQVERFSGYLRNTSVEEITDEVRGFARGRSPLFLGSAVALGFLATRFLKSTSRGGAGGPSAGGATSSATVSHGSGEPATARPSGTITDYPDRTPMAGNPQSL